MGEFPQDPETGVMICIHGTRDEGAVIQLNTLTGHLKKRLPQYDIESGFLEFASPVMSTGLDALKELGAERILCLPGMLFASGHSKNNLPSELNKFATANPKIDVRYGRELAIDRRLLKAAAERIEEAEALAETKVERASTLLMVAGHGTNDSDANSNTCKVARMLWEGMGFGWAEVSYSGVTTPLVDAGLTQAVKLGYRRIIVYPFFLFTGILVQRIYDLVDEAAAAHPEVEILNASYLNDHPLLIDAFIDRIGEMLSGEKVMNCQLCEYREQIIGFEGDIGQLQVGHQHHDHADGDKGS